MDYIDFRHHLTRCADGLDSHNLSPQSPFSDVREPAAGDDLILDLVSGELPNKITFRKLSRGSSKFPQHFEGVRPGSIWNPILLQHLQGGWKSGRCESL